MFYQNYHVIWFRIAGYWCTQDADPCGTGNFFPAIAFIAPTFGRISTPRKKRLGEE
jgi:hypothetical protein